MRHMWVGIDRRHHWILYRGGKSEEYPRLRAFHRLRGCRSQLIMYESATKEYLNSLVEDFRIQGKHMDVIELGEEI